MYKYGYIYVSICIYLTYIIYSMHIDYTRHWYCMGIRKIVINTVAFPACSLPLCCSLFHALSSASLFARSQLLRIVLLQVKCDNA